MSYEREPEFITDAMRKAVELASSVPWPDIFGTSTTTKAEERPCVRCKRLIATPVCPRCRAVQATYRP